MVRARSVPRDVNHVARRSRRRAPAPPSPRCAPACARAALRGAALPQRLLRLLLLRAAAGDQRRWRRQRGGRGRRFGAGAAGIGGGFGADRREREETAQFQEYVRRRLDEIGAKMPQPLGAAEAMEADFLEEQVIEYQMSSKRRKMRDPLRDVAVEITHTGLPLLCRFVSESGAILPRKLTGVSARKQKKLTLAIKRAQVLALMPKTWKLPQYMRRRRRREPRPGTSATGRPPEDADFEDPPDPRFHRRPTAGLATTARRGVS